MVGMSDCIILDCEYSVVAWAIATEYTCTARVIFVGDAREVSDVTENHMEGRNNSDVKGLLIYNQNITFTPRNIHLFFPNVVAFSLFNNTIEEITPVALGGLHKLRYFNFLYNHLQVVESDLFDESPLLEWIDFGYNPIRHVAHNVFKHLNLLENLNFTLTTCISQSAVGSDDVELLKFQLIVACPATFEMTETKIVNGIELHNQINRQINDAINPLTKMLLEIEENQKALEHRVDILEGGGNDDN